MTEYKLWPSMLMPIKLFSHVPPFLGPRGLLRLEDLFVFFDAVLNFSDFFFSPPWAITAAKKLEADNRLTGGR